MARLIANVIKASSPRAARKGRTYGRTAPVWGQQRKKVYLKKEFAGFRRFNPRKLAISKTLDPQKSTPAQGLRSFFTDD
jgi:hypothetical protein